MPPEKALCIGTDIEEVDRFRQLIARHGSRFLNKVFTAGEIKYCSAKKHSAQHYAARFAAKEAVIKAVSHIERFDLLQIEVLSDNEGRPRISLQSARLVDPDALSLSISHSRHYAVATVLYNAAASS